MIKSQSLGDRSAKALDYAQDSVKQILGLSTGVVALTATFFRDFAGAGSAAARYCMIASWTFFLISIISGLWSLLSMTSDLWPKKEADRTGEVDIWKRNLRNSAMVQVISFGIASFLLLAAGWLALTSPSVAQPKASLSSVSSASSIPTLEVSSRLRQ